MSWLSSGVVLGIGLGGFADGILLHQIAQWHNMGSAVLPPTTMDAMSRNMRWDGLFQLHHVRDIPFDVPIYDWIFLAVGRVGSILLGVALMVPSSAVSASRA